MNTQAILLTLLHGFGTTCLLFALTLVFAAPLGLLISFGSMSRVRPLRWLTKTCVWAIRGTPLMLQVIIVFYGPGLLWGLRWGGPSREFSAMFAVLVAFIINYAAYFSEIYRAGIEGVPHGQYEAGLVLGMTKTQIFFKITLLQVVKRIVPPMSNEIITLVKDTSLARVIAVREIVMEAFTFTTKGLIWPLFSSGLFFLAFCGVLTLLFGHVERKLSYFKV
ncbi:MAG: amino acid ABC transporter permease [Clostridiales Family XIII bacterium]|jgi:polar amino acid transport system permease protein|nr:amino acid ABC transporter permease [Clostridiales Family XIII bacterium]